MKKGGIKIDPLHMLLGGAVEERYEQEMQKVLENIQDLNTDATKERSVTIKIKIKPNPNRSMLNYEVDTSAKVAPFAAVGTTLLMGMDADGQVVALEAGRVIPGQQAMEGTEQAKTNNIVPLAELKTEGGK